MQREQALLQTVQNMTALVTSMEQREEIACPLLMLTERVMDVKQWPRRIKLLQRVPQ
jgi:hypothetical protein